MMIYRRNVRFNNHFFKNISIVQCCLSFVAVFKYFGKGVSMALESSNEIMKISSHIKILLGDENCQSHGLANSNINEKTFKEEQLNLENKDQVEKNEKREHSLQNAIEAHPIRKKLRENKFDFENCNKNTFNSFNCNIQIDTKGDYYEKYCEQRRKILDKDNFTQKKQTKLQVENNFKISEFIPYHTKNECEENKHYLDHVNSENQLNGLEKNPQKLPILKDKEDQNYAHMVKNQENVMHTNNERYKQFGNIFQISDLCESSTSDDCCSLNNNIEESGDKQTSIKSRPNQIVTETTGLDQKLVECIFNINIDSEKPNQKEMKLDESRCVVNQEQKIKHLIPINLKTAENEQYNYNNAQEMREEHNNLNLFIQLPLNEIDSVDNINNDQRNLRKSFSHIVRKTLAETESVIENDKSKIPVLYNPENRELLEQCPITSTLNFNDDDKKFNKRPLRSQNYGKNPISNQPIIKRDSINLHYGRRSLDRSYMQFDINKLAKKRIVHNFLSQFQFRNGNKYGVNDLENAFEPNVMGISSDIQTLKEDVHYESHAHIALKINKSSPEVKIIDTDNKSQEKNKENNEQEEGKSTEKESQILVKNEIKDQEDQCRNTIDFVPEAVINTRENTQYMDKVTPENVTENVIPIELDSESIADHQGQNIFTIPVNSIERNYYNFTRNQQIRVMSLNSCSDNIENEPKIFSHAEMKKIESILKKPIFKAEPSDTLNYSCNLEDINQGIKKNILTLSRVGENEVQEQAKNQVKSETKDELLSNQNEYMLMENEYQKEKEHESPSACKLFEKYLQNPKEAELKTTDVNCHKKISTDKYLSSNESIFDNNVYKASLKYELLVELLSFIESQKRQELSLKRKLEYLVNNQDKDDIDTIQLNPYQKTYIENESDIIECYQRQNVEEPIKNSPIYSDYIKAEDNQTQDQCQLVSKPVYDDYVQKIHKRSSRNENQCISTEYERGTEDSINEIRKENKKKDRNDINKITKKKIVRNILLQNQFENKTKDMVKEFKYDAFEQSVIKLLSEIEKLASENRYRSNAHGNIGANHTAFKAQPTNFDINEEDQMDEKAEHSVQYVAESYPLLQKLSKTSEYEVYENKMQTKKGEYIWQNTSEFRRPNQLSDNTIGVKLSEKKSKVESNTSGHKYIDRIQPISQENQCQKMSLMGTLQTQDGIIKDLEQSQRATKQNQIKLVRKENKSPQMERDIQKIAKKGIVKNFLSLFQPRNEGTSKKYLKTVENNDMELAYENIGGNGNLNNATSRADVEHERNMLNKNRITQTEREKSQLKNVQLYRFFSDNKMNAPNLTDTQKMDQLQISELDIIEEEITDDEKQIFKIIENNKLKLINNPEHKEVFMEPDECQQTPHLPIVENSENISNIPSNNNVYKNPKVRKARKNTERTPSLKRYKREAELYDHHDFAALPKIIPRRKDNSLISILMAKKQINTSNSNHYLCIKENQGRQFCNGSQINQEESEISKGQNISPQKTSSQTSHKLNRSLRRERYDIEHDIQQLTKKGIVHNILYRSQVRNTIEQIVDDNNKPVM